MEAPIDPFSLAEQIVQLVEHALHPGKGKTKSRVETIMEVMEILKKTRRPSSVGKPGRGKYAIKGKLPDNLTNWDKILKNPKIQSIVTDTRKELFRSAKTPFKKLGEATTWIESESKRGEKKDTQKETNKKFSPILLLQFPISETNPDLELVGSGWVRSFCPANTPKLNTLAKASKKLADNLGWTEVRATAYILLGFLPENYRLTWRIGTVPWVDLRLYPGAMNKPTLEGILGEIRSQLGFYLPTDQESLLTDKHLAVIHLINQLGNPPIAGQRGKSVGYLKYWDDFATEWNTRFPQFPSNAVALEKYWRRKYRGA